MVRVGMKEGKSFVIDTPEEEKEGREKGQEAEEEIFPFGYHCN